MARRRPRASINTPGAPVATGRRPQPTTRRNPSLGPGFHPGLGQSLSNAVSQIPQSQQIQPFPGFTPYTPPPIPSGSYDPALDAARQAAARGLGNLTQDTETQAARDLTDYGAQRDRILQQQARGTQDLNSQVSALQRSFSNLQARQTDQINASGLSGGAALQAAAKRQANEQIAMQPINTERTRLQQDTGTALGDLALNYAPPSADNPLGGRRYQDRATALARAGIEDTQFGISTQAEKAYQAAGAGYVAPQRGEKGGIPKNEHITGAGVHFQTHRVGNVIYRVDQHGRVIGKRRVRG